MEGRTAEKERVKADKRGGELKGDNNRSEVKDDEVGGRQRWKEEEETFKYCE